MNLGHELKNIKACFCLYEGKNICNSTYIFKGAEGSLSPVWEADKEQLVYLN